jgi:hypothetical protein
LKSKKAGADQKAECISFQLEDGSMRRPIETAPKDGTTVILEDGVNGTYELARWSAQECAWVSKNGKRYEVAPTYWHAVERAEHLEGECQSQAGGAFPNLDAEPQRTPASAAVFIGPPVVASSEAASVVSPDKQIPAGKARVSAARRRFSAACGAAMVALALTGMYFRGDVAAYATKHANGSDESRVANTPQALPMEQPRKISLARNPTVSQAEADAASAPASAAQVTVGRAPTQNPENVRRADAMQADAIQKELFNARQALAEAQEREAQLKQTADTARTELQQSLDKIATLESELALARQSTDQASPSPRRARRIAQRRLKHPNPPGFFGVFNLAPNRGPLQSSARMR